MKHWRPFLLGLLLVLVFDAAWWLLAYSLPPIGVQSPSGLSGPWVVFLTLDPTVVLPWLAIGLFVVLAGWTRRSSAAARLWVALGALTGTVTAFAILAYFLFTGCGCEPG